MASLPSLLCVLVVAGTAIMTAECNPILDGWFHTNNGLKFRAIRKLSDFKTAQNECKKLGGQLAFEAMKSLELRIAIGNILLPESTFWIGMNAVGSEREWKWVDGSSVSTKDAHWRDGEPNNVAGNERCAETRKIDGYKTNDVSCDAVKMALCEAPSYLRVVPFK